MLFYIILSVCLSMVYTIPAEYFELEPPSPELMKCMSTHSKEWEKCSDVLVAKPFQKFINKKRLNIFR